MFAKNRSLWVMLFTFMIGICTVHAEKNTTANYLKKDDAWFSKEEARTIAQTLLTYQSESGGWPKNTNTAQKPYRGKKEDLEPTFDNGATTDELRFLARIYRQTKDKQYAEAFAKGLNYILEAQYENGGWPQFHPPGKKYHRYITFNDGAMVRLMEFVREVSRDPLYEFVPAAQRTQCMQAFERGVACILRCQITIDGKLTIWCAQHDEIDFRPQLARAYELPSLSGGESAGIIRLLMSIEKPSPEIIRSVNAAVAWYESAKLTGIRIEEVRDNKSPSGKNRVVVKDRKADPLWARFYDLKTQKPMFCDRDGIPKSDIAEIGYERRNGYAWYGNWGLKLLEKEYPQWKRKNR